MSGSKTFSGLLFSENENFSDSASWLLDLNRCSSSLMNSQLREKWFSRNITNLVVPQIDAYVNTYTGTK